MIFLGNQHINYLSATGHQGRKVLFLLIWQDDPGRLDCLSEAS